MEKQLTPWGFFECDFWTAIGSGVFQFSTPLHVGLFSLTITTNCRRVCVKSLAYIKARWRIHKPLSRIITSLILSIVSLIKKQSSRHTC